MVILDGVKNMVKKSSSKYMKEKQGKIIDDVDKNILTMIQDDAAVSLEEIGNALGMSKTAIHYRINKLRDERVIKKIMAILDPGKVGYDIFAITFIKAKYGPSYQKNVGEKIKKIKGVWAVYFLLGDIDFVVLIRAKNRDDLRRIVNTFINTPEIERSSTHIVLEIVKEDPKIDLD